MRPAMAKIPATIPTTAPLTSRQTFAVISAFARAISSRTRSCAFSVTSWTARPSSDVLLSAMSVEELLEDAPQQERADEGRAGLDLGPLHGALLARRPGGLRGAGAAPAA